jgi:hypothetical protein
MVEFWNHDCVSERKALSSGAISWRIDEVERMWVSINKVIGIITRSIEILLLQKVSFLFEKF